jgi:hypothetical protein
VPYRTTARAGHTQAVIADFVVPYLVVGTVHAHLAVRQSPTKVRYSRIAVSSRITCAGPSLPNGQSDRLQIIQQSFECSSYFGRRKEAHWWPLGGIHRPGLSAIWRGRGRVRPVYMALHGGFFCAHGEGVSKAWDACDNDCDNMSGLLGKPP